MSWPEPKLEVDEHIIPLGISGDLAKYRIVEIKNKSCVVERSNVTGNHSRFTYVAVSLLRLPFEDMRRQNELAVTRLREG